MFTRETNEYECSLEVLGIEDGAKVTSLMSIESFKKASQRETTGDMKSAYRGYREQS
jgi:hypothetical protein